MNKKSFFVFIFVIVSGIALRIFGLNIQGVGFDECALSFISGQADLIKLLKTVYSDASQPPLFYILVHFVLKWFGVSEISLRIVPLLFSIINLFIVFKMARSFFSEEIALITLILFSFSAYQIYFSQEGAVYSAALTFALLIIYYFLISVKYNSFTGLPFIIFSVMGLYTHTYIFILVIIINLLYFIKYKEDIRQGLWLRANLIIFVLSLPVLVFWLRIPDYNLCSNKVDLLLAPFYSLKSSLCGLTCKINPLIFIFILFNVFLIAIAIISNRRYNEKKIIDILWIFTIIFMAVPWVKSFFGKQIFATADIIIISFVFLLLSSVGISYLFKGIKITTILLYVLVNMFSLYNGWFVEKYQKINYRDLYKKMSYNNIQEKRLIVHTGISSFVCFKFYNETNKEDDFTNILLYEPKTQSQEFNASFMKFMKGGLDFGKYDYYKKDVFTAEEAEKMSSGYSWVYVIIDDENAVNQIFMPQSHIWEKDAIPYNVYGIKDIAWVKKLFKIDRMDDIYGVKIYFLVKAK